MSNKEKFEEWFQQQSFYLNLRFIHGERLFIFDAQDGYVVQAVQIAWETWKEQQKQIDELKQDIKKWKAQSIMSVIHGTCDCGEPWQVIVSNKEGFNQLHCFACGKDRYENKDFFGEESALKGGDE